MTIFHHSPSLAIKVKATAVRVAVGSVLALVGATVALLVLSATDPAQQLSALTDWLVASYYVIFGVLLVSMSILGVMDNAKESKKTQYDIR